MNSSSKLRTAAAAAGSPSLSSPAPGATTGTAAVGQMQVSAAPSRSWSAASSASASSCGSSRSSPRSNGTQCAAGASSSGSGRARPHQRHRAGRLRRDLRRHRPQAPEQLERLRRRVWRDPRRDCAEHPLQPDVERGAPMTMWSTAFARAYSRSAAAGFVASSTWKEIRVPRSLSGSAQWRSSTRCLRRWLVAVSSGAEPPSSGEGGTTVTQASRGVAAGCDDTTAPPPGSPRACASSECSVATAASTIDAPGDVGRSAAGTARARARSPHPALQHLPRARAAHPQAALADRHLRGVRRDRTRPGRRSGSARPRPPRGSGGSPPATTPGHPARSRAEGRGRATAACRSAAGEVGAPNGSSPVASS